MTRLKVLLILVFTILFLGWITNDKPQTVDAARAKGGGSTGMCRPNEKLDLIINPAAVDIVQGGSAQVSVTVICVSK